jgi:AcrR family transcriptional regulator
MARNWRLTCLLRNLDNFMSATFQEQLIQARRNLIIDAAIEVISEQGFQRTTIKQIASKAGIADGTIYNYFKSKDDILLGIVARLSEEEAQDVGMAEVAELDFAAFLEMFVQPRMNEINGRYQTLKVVLPEMMTNPELGSRAYEQIYGPMFVVIEQYFQQLIADGQIDGSDPALAARLFASPFMGLIMLRMLGDAHVVENWEAYTDAMSHFLRKALANSAH